MPKPTAKAQTEEESILENVEGLMQDAVAFNAAVTAVREAMRKATAVLNITAAELSMPEQRAS
jgi:hypothetical protein